MLFSKFSKILEECQKLIGEVHKLIYVEHPYWWNFSPDDFLISDE